MPGTVILHLKADLCLEKMRAERRKGSLVTGNIISVGGGQGFSSEKDKKDIYLHRR